MWWQRETTLDRVAPSKEGEPIRDRPFLIYDRDCGFCSYWVEYWKAITEERVEYAASQEVADRFPQISAEAFRSSIQLVEREGKVFQGAEAVLRALAQVPEKRWLVWCYYHLPAFGRVAQVLYRLIARYRGRLLGITSFLWGVLPRPSHYHFSRWLFVRLLGIVYLIAFVSLWSQVNGLIGSQGVLPVGAFLEAVKSRFGAEGYWLVPTIAWFSQADGMLQFLAGGGTILSLLVIAGIVVGPALLLLWLFYLSLVAAGQDFLSFQWDLLLLEVGFLSIFFASWKAPASHWRLLGVSVRESSPSVVLLWLLRWVLFRLMFLSGAVKLLSGDETWRNLTALAYHYETQPLPNVISWFVHQMPAWFQKVSAAGMFGIEFLVPFFYFAPRNLRHAAAALTILLQGLVFLTGNYTFFNILVIAVCVLLIDDAVWKRVFPKKLMEVASVFDGVLPRALASRRAIGILASFVLFVSLVELSAIFLVRLPPALGGFLRIVAPWRVVNTYGLFAVMTTSRPEIIVEGSRDGTVWAAYEFHYKPEGVSRRPGWAAPHQPRLDWQMWFAALRVARDPVTGSVLAQGQSYDPWFLNFVTRLLQGSPDVVSLLEGNPFLISPPRFIRAMVYEYHFTTPLERRAAGDWWKRDLKGVYLPLVSLGARQ